MAVTHSRRKGPVCDLLKDEYRGYEMTGFNRKFGLPGRLVLLGALAAVLLLLTRSKFIAKQVAEYGV